MRVRQSMLGTADKCLRAIQWDVDGSPDGKLSTGIARELGTGVHAALEALYEKAPNWPYTTEQLCEIGQTSLLAAFDKYDYWIWSETIPDMETALVVNDTLIEMYVREKHYWPVFRDTPEEERWEVIGCEVPFTIPDPDLTGPLTGEVGTRTGTTDLVLRTPDGGIVGCDHKTSGKAWPQNKHHPRKNNQAPWYWDAYKVLYPDAPSWRIVFDILTYHKPGKKNPDWHGTFERRISNVQQAHADAVRKKAVDLAFIVDLTLGSGRDLPADPSNTLCSPAYCDHFRYCPHGQILDT